MKKQGRLPVSCLFKGMTETCNKPLITSVYPHGIALLYLDASPEHCHWGRGCWERPNCILLLHGCNSGLIYEDVQTLELCSSVSTAFD
jgi:hypothetical protein